MPVQKREVSVAPTFIPTALQVVQYRANRIPYLAAVLYDDLGLPELKKTLVEILTAIWGTLTLQ